VEWASKAELFTGVSTDEGDDKIMEFLDDLFLPESLEIKMFISGCDHDETKAAVDKFWFNEDAIVMYTKWLGFGRKSDVTITACEADGGSYR
jgi:hypothetical protein